MAQKEHIRELDLARVLSMLAVIMIHVSAPYINRPSDFALLGMNLGWILNQVTRFAVPLFVLLSGTSLGFSSSADRLGSFYRKRAVKIGLPYVVWFAIYYGYDYLHSAVPMGLEPRRILRAFLQGQGAPHLYFIIVVAQCYLLYPLLKKAVDRAPGVSVAVSLGVTALVQTLFALRREGVADLIPGWIAPYLWLLFPTWAFFFVLGMALTAERLHALRRFTAAHPWPLVGLGLVSMVLYVLVAHWKNSLDSIKLSLDLYVPAMLVFVFALWQLAGRFRVVSAAVKFLSAHAMTVYFCHVLVLYQFQEHWRFTSGMRGMLELYVVTTVLSVLLAWVLDGLGSLLKRKV